MRLKKITKSLLLIIMLLVSSTLLLKVEAATSAPNTIKVESEGRLPEYINGTEFAKKVTTDGKYVYCANKHLKTPADMVLTLEETKDAGMAYIMTNGYPHKSFTGNDNYDYYITQTAVWWYLDDTTGSDNLSESFKTTATDEHGLRKYIIQLKEAAKSSKNNGYTKPSVAISTSSTTFTVSSDGKYYYSSYITVNGTSLNGNVTLSLSGAPEGTSIVDSNGNSKTTVAAGTKVRIRVPVSNVSNLETSITMTANATGKIDKAYSYKPDNNKYQPVIVSVLFSETQAVNTTKKFSLKATQVEILKVDTETKKALAGAKLQLKNANGEVVAEWTTTTSAKVIKDLPAGTYKLVEVEAPEGYKLDTAAQEVNLEAGVSTKVSFYNEKEPTEVVIIKKDKETNKILTGAIFVMKDKAGKEVKKWTSSANGDSISGLPEGEYTVEELQAPDGYIKSDEIQTVKLEAGKTVTITFYNKKEEIDKPESIIKITKVNGETGENLAGATLVLKDANGNEIATWTTTAETYIIENVEPGKYYLSETSAPEGFVLSTEVVEIIVTEDGGTQIITFYNTPEIEVPNTSSTISKIAIIFGVITMGIGGSIVYINLRKEEI